jgi:hypothetical protein
MKWLVFIRKFTTNTFTISTPALMPIGACVSPVVALINHSCDPNAVVVFPRAGGESRKYEEPLMQVIALKCIAPDEEVCVSFYSFTFRFKLNMFFLDFNCLYRYHSSPKTTTEFAVRDIPLHMLLSVMYATDKWSN